MSNQRLSSQGQSKEQALAANDDHLLRSASHEEAVFIGFDLVRGSLRTQDHHLTSRRSRVRAAHCPLAGRATQAAINH